MIGNYGATALTPLFPSPSARHSAGGGRGGGWVRTAACSCQSSAPPTQGRWGQATGERRFCTLSCVERYLALQRQKTLKHFLSWGTRSQRGSPGSPSAPGKKRTTRASQTTGPAWVSLTWKPFHEGHPRFHRAFSGRAAGASQASRGVRGGRPAVPATLAGTATRGRFVHPVSEPERAERAAEHRRPAPGRERADAPERGYSSVFSFLSGVVQR